MLSGLSKINAASGVRFSRWWAEQYGRYPNWCGPLEQASNYYDEMFLKQSVYHVPYTDSPDFPVWTVILERLKTYDTSSVLEIGCGVGQFASMALDAGIASYLGLDFSEQAIAIARNAEPRANFVVGDARYVDVYERFSYDALVCTEVLEHIEDDLVVIRRFPQSMRCLCSVPNFGDLAHVRYFENEEAVIGRYGVFFDSLDVIPVKVLGSESAVLFVLDGIRSGHQ